MSRPSKNQRLTPNQRAVAVSNTKWIRFFQSMLSRPLLEMLSTDDLGTLLDGLSDPQKKEWKRLYKEKHPEAKKKQVQKWLEKQLPIRPAGLYLMRSIQQIVGQTISADAVTPLLQMHKTNGRLRVIRLLTFSSHWLGQPFLSPKDWSLVLKNSPLQTLCMEFSDEHNLPSAYFEAVTACPNLQCLSWRQNTYLSYASILEGKKITWPKLTTCSLHSNYTWEAKELDSFLLRHPQLQHIKLVGEVYGLPALVSIAKHCLDIRSVHLLCPIFHVDLRNDPAQEEPLRKLLQECKTLESLTIGSLHYPGQHVAWTFAEQHKGTFAQLCTGPTSEEYGQPFRPGSVVSYLRMAGKRVKTWSNVDCLVSSLDMKQPNMKDLLAASTDLKAGPFQIERLHLRRFVEFPEGIYESFFQQPYIQQMLLVWPSLVSLSLSVTSESSLFHTYSHSFVDLTRNDATSKSWTVRTTGSAQVKLAGFLGREIQFIGDTWPGIEALICETDGIEFWNKNPETHPLAHVAAWGERKTCALQRFTFGTVAVNNQGILGSRFPQRIPSQYVATILQLHPLVELQLGTEYPIREFQHMEQAMKAATECKTLQHLTLSFANTAPTRKHFLALAARPALRTLRLLAKSEKQQEEAKVNREQGIDLAAVTQVCKQLHDLQTLVLDLEWPFANLSSPSVGETWLPSCKQLSHLYLQVASKTLSQEQLVLLLRRCPRLNLANVRFKCMARETVPHHRTCTPPEKEQWPSSLRDQNIGWIYHPSQAEGEYLWRGQTRFVYVDTRDLYCERPLLYPLSLRATTGDVVTHFSPSILDNPLVLTKSIGNTEKKVKSKKRLEPSKFSRATVETWMKQVGDELVQEEIENHIADVRTPEGDLSLFVLEPRAQKLLQEIQGLATKPKEPLVIYEDMEDTQNKIRQVTISKTSEGTKIHSVVLRDGLSFDEQAALLRALSLRVAQLEDTG